jgi:hypothetical protein
MPTSPAATLTVSTTAPTHISAPAGPFTATTGAAVDPFYATDQNSFSSGIAGRMHLPFRQSPAPAMRGYADAILRQLELVSTNALSRALYLETAEKRWLDLWGATYSLERKNGESDTVFRQRILDWVQQVQRSGLNDLRQEIANATGIALSVMTLARPKILATSSWQSLYDGGWEVSGDLNLPLFNQPSAMLPIPPVGGFGQGGFVVYINLPYNPTQDAAVVAALRDTVLAGARFEIVWADGLPANRTRYGERDWIQRAVAANGIATNGNDQIVSYGLPVFVQP